MRVAFRSSVGRTWPLAAIAVALFVSDLPLAAQAPPPGDPVTTVTITSPRGTPQDPFRTSFTVFRLEFTHDGGPEGVFFASSEGADTPGSNILINEPAGSVGAFFSVAGRKSLSVRVTRREDQSTAVSSPVVVVFDNVPPVVRVTAVQRDPRLGFEAFVPGRRYVSGAEQFGIRGFVTDGQDGSPPEDITVEACVRGQPPVPTTPDLAGQFEVFVPLSGLPDGELSLGVTARDRMDDSSPGNESRPVSIGLGGD